MSNDSAHFHQTFSADCFIRTWELLPSTSGFYDVPKNADGSIDIWFAPKKPDGVADSAFIQTVPNRHFIAALRLYGTGVEFFDQAWKPDDLVKAK